MVLREKESGREREKCERKKSKELCPPAAAAAAAIERILSSPPAALISRRRVSSERSDDKVIPCLDMTRAGHPWKAEHKADGERAKAARRGRSQESIAAAAVAGVFAPNRLLLEPYLLLSLGRVGSGKRLSLLGLLDLGRLLSSGFEWREREQERERAREKR